MGHEVNPRRTINELRELRMLTSDEHGAQRVAFSELWIKARRFLEAKLGDLPVEKQVDAAGNSWVTLRGESQQELLIGGHIDSVPNGGWLDGSLNLLAGLEVLRRVFAQYGGRPPVTIRLVDWADEEGARFGKSLFGSSACSGNLWMEEARGLVDKDGVTLPQALQEVGIDFARVKDCGGELKNAAAYLELHVEQGPVLLERGLPLGTVLGTCGVERHAVIFRGQAAHSGSTPMNLRRDAFLAAARMAPEIQDVAARSGEGVCTIGSCTTKPGIVTSVAEECRITLDQRHLEADVLARMLEEAKAASYRFAAEGGCLVEWQRLCQVPPAPFHPELIQMCDEAIHELAGASMQLPSGPLHDATEVSRAGVPTVMMFVQSLHGISHNKIEDTREEDIELSVRVLDRLAEKTMHWILSQGV